MPSPPSNTPDDRTTEALARSASLLSIGAVASRVLGLAREMVIASYFGATGPVSAFTAASTAPKMLYDFLVGGMLSAALVPVLSDYARLDRNRKDSAQEVDQLLEGAKVGPNPELVRLVGALLSLAVVSLAGLALLMAFFAPQVAGLLAGGFDDFDPALLPLTAQLVRLMAPVVWFISMAGLLTGVLFALQRFSVPALASAVYNLGIVVAAPLLAGRVGIVSLAVGVLAGSMVQFGLMAWDLRRAGLKFTVRWSHPALGRIVRLYLPIAAGLIVAQFQVGLDRRLASGTGVQSIAWMSKATTLQQMPLGMISVAISLAALPRLSQQFAAGDEGAYRATLAKGLRMVLVMIVPLLVGLGLLAEPTVRLLFERGQFTADDTAQVVSALQVYLVGALFASIDFPLIYAFYARNDTLLPALVGVLSVLVYAVLALALIEGLGFLGLVWADTAKQGAHAVVMLGLLYWKLGNVATGWRPYSAGEKVEGRGKWGIGPTVRSFGSVIGAAVAMALVMAWLLSLLNPGGETSLSNDLLRIVVCGGGGALAYAGFLLLVGQPEARQLGRAAMRLRGLARVK
ncbi:MAG: murein biosynthesis integral membrane protein MurJ [Caldilineaceae bacterium]|nr:murein biosynthesis integral membrane protein MurJ [Caldilineaceae bacterium]